MSGIGRLHLIVDDRAALRDVQRWVDDHWPDVESRTTIVSEAWQAPDTAPGDVAVIAVDAPGCLEVTATLRALPVVLCVGDAPGPAAAQAAGAGAICAAGCPPRVVAGHVACLAECEPGDRVFVDSRPWRPDRTTAQIVDTITRWHPQLVEGGRTGRHCAARARELADLLRALPGGRNDPLEVPVDRAMHALIPVALRLANQPPGHRGAPLERFAHLVERWYTDQASFH